MPRELITVSVGQAGNQIGHRFWEMAVKEHAAFNTDGLFTESMSRWELCEGTNLAWQCRQELLQEERLQGQIPLAPASHATLSCADPRTCRSCYTSPVVPEPLPRPSIPAPTPQLLPQCGRRRRPAADRSRQGRRAATAAHQRPSRSSCADRHGKRGTAGCVVCNRWKLMIQLSWYGWKLMLPHAASRAALAGWHCMPTAESRLPPPHISLFLPPSRSLMPRPLPQEEGVVNGILRGPLAELFDSRQLLTDVSGAGNNWAVGNRVYGPQYRDSLSNVIRSQARQGRGSRLCRCRRCWRGVAAMMASHDAVWAREWRLQCLAAMPASSSALP